MIKHEEGEKCCRVNHIHSAEKILIASSYIESHMRLITAMACKLQGTQSPVELKSFGGHGNGSVLAVNLHQPAAYVQCQGGSTGKMRVRKWWWQAEWLEVMASD